MFPSLKTAVIFPDSLMHERQITERAFVFLELWQEGRLTKELHIPHFPVCQKILSLSDSSKTFLGVE